MRKHFFGTIWDDLLISAVKLKLCWIFLKIFLKISKMVTILRSRQILLREVIQEVEYASKIAISISDILSFDRRSSWNINRDISFSQFQFVRSITSITRHRQLSKYKILSAWHQCFIIKSSGHTWWQTQTYRHTQTQRVKTLSLRCRGWLNKAKLRGELSVKLLVIDKGMLPTKHKKIYATSDSYWAAI